MKTSKQDIFLIARYRRVPKFKGMTSQKDFGKNEDNWQWDEQVDFKQKLSDKDFISSHVVLALHQRKVLRNAMNPEAGYDELYMYFYSNGHSKQLEKIREAENMVKAAVAQAMEEYKAEHPELTERVYGALPPEGAVHQIGDRADKHTNWHFPKAEDFEPKAGEGFVDSTELPNTVSND